jgi:hypothetical protein
MRRGEVHIYGIAEFRTTGTITGSEDDAWRIEDVDGRPVRALRRREDGDLKIGDNVESEPRFQSSRGTRLNLIPDWLIVRRL